MNIALWIIASLLAFAFLGAGLMKITADHGAVQAKLPWVADVTPTQLKVIGAVEALGAIGLIVPALTGILPVLTPIAATGLAITMAFAVALHVRRRETLASSVPAMVLGLLAATIAVGRFGLISF
ncbi:MAG: DoxX family protein [Micropruina sp.]|nr:DoxX family protein [Micropruina sp.]